MALFSRRQFLAGAAATLSTPALLRATDSLRVATLDWALLETLLAIGANVVAGTELRQFREVAVTPVVPGGVADLGLRGTPNFEVLRFARPELIFNSNFYAWADVRMQPIAPVESHAIYKPGESPYALAEQATIAEVLKRVGLTNAWQGATSYSAAAPVGIETLASMPDAWIVMIAPQPADALATLSTSAFWNALPAVREKRVLMLGSINPYGALPAALRFADLLQEGLGHAWNG
jgi:ABC-type Fe3+-hydroxamate transport system substrate-binding protein